jgi:hypothetical protein
MGRRRLDQTDDMEPFFKQFKNNIYKKDWAKILDVKNNVIY